MFLWGAPMLAFGTYVLLSWRPSVAFEWLGYLLIALLFIFGLSLVVTSFTASEERLDRATNCISDGGDIVGMAAALAVGLVALPLVALARRVWPRRT